MRNVENRDAESLFFVGLRLRLLVRTSFCDILIVYFRMNGQKNLNSSDKRCTTLYTMYKQPRTTVLSSMYNQGVGLRTRSRSLPQKEYSDSDSTPLVENVKPVLYQNGFALSYKEIQVSSKIGVLLSRTLSQTLKLADFSASSPRHVDHSQVLST